MEQRSERGLRLNHIFSVSCVSSVVLMGRETGSLQLLAPLLLTGGKGADLVIRGNVVLNKSLIPAVRHGTGRAHGHDQPADPPAAEAGERAERCLGGWRGMGGGRYMGLDLR
jgi:hypothetical protein